MSTACKSPLRPDFAAEILSQDFPTNERPSRPHGGVFRNELPFADSSPGED